MAQNPQKLSKIMAAGTKSHMYDSILKKEQKYMVLMVFDQTGNQIKRKELTDDSVPTQPMELYIDIWY